MKSWLVARIGVAPFLLPPASALFAQAPQLPPNCPQAQYDESKVPKYTLPDPLVLLNGKKVRDAETWTKKRWPENLRLFESHVYGRTMAGRHLRSAGVPSGSGAFVTGHYRNLFVEALWNTPVPSGQWRYYDGMLYLLGLLHCSGEFRIWTPR